MRLIIFLFGFLSGSALFGQGTTTADYYQYQRDQQFKQYMENVSSKGMASPANTSFDYSIDRKALQEMAEMWDKRNKRPGLQYSPEELAKLNAEKQRIEEQKRRDEIAADKAWEQRTLAYSAMMPLYVKMFEEAGFPKAEAEILANERIKEVRPTPNSSLGVLAYVDHPQGDLAYNAFKKYQQIKATAPFEDLIFLINDFSFTGYSAVKALEYLETRFPEKKDIITTLKPFYGISFWQPRKGYIAHQYSGSSLRLEMLDYLFDWAEKMPQETVSLLENGSYWHNLIRDEVESKKRWQQVSRFMVNMALHGRFGFAQKGKLMEDYRYWLYRIKLDKQREAETRIPKMFTWQDFEAVKNRYNVSGIEAMELLGVVARKGGNIDMTWGPQGIWADPVYIEDIKQYADVGDKDARVLYAVHQVKQGNKDEKREAYKLLRELLEEKHPYVAEEVEELDLHEKIGFDKKTIKDYYVLKAESRQKKPAATVVHPELNKQGEVLFDNWQTAKSKYTWSGLETSETDANVHRYVKDDALNFTAKTDNYTWGVTNLNQTKTSNFIYETTIRLDQSYQGNTYGEVGLIIELEEKQGVTPTKLLFMIKPGSRRFFVGSYNPNGTKWTAFTSPHEEGGWVYSEYVKEKHVPFPEYILSVRKEGNTYHFYIDQAYMFSHYTNESEAKFAGIGVIQKGKCKGQMSSTRFVNEIKD
jgi:hypothetical protein